MGHGSAGSGGGREVPLSVAGAGREVGGRVGGAAPYERGEVGGKVDGREVSSRCDVGGRLGGRPLNGAVGAALGRGSGLAASASARPAIPARRSAT